MSITVVDLWKTGVPPKLGLPPRQHHIRATCQWSRGRRAKRTSRTCFTGYQNWTKKKKKISPVGTFSWEKEQATELSGCTKKKRKKKKSKIASSCLKEHDSDKGRGSLWWVFKDGKEQDIFMCRDAKNKLQGAAEMKDTSSTVSVEGQDAV